MMKRDKNDDRALWAERALQAFMATTGTDREYALADLLGDLLHWCSRNDTDFESELERARGYYAEELLDPDC